MLPKLQKFDVSDINNKLATVIDNFIPVLMKYCFKEYIFINKNIF